jgi:hypothetical protein
MKNSLSLIWILLLLWANGGLLAQGGAPGNYPSLKVNGALQIWGRYTENNPGTLKADELQPYSWDVSIRRLRLKAKGQLSEKFHYCLQIGNNNINQRTVKKPRIRLIDAYVEYRFDRSLSLGMGKSAWTGLSRYSAPSTSRLLGLDLPYIATPTVGVSDDLLRKYGVFAYGLIEKWEYRLSLAKPFATERTLSQYADFASGPSQIQTSLYLKYHLLDREKTGSPFSPGTYRGTKRVLTLGAGFLQQPKAMHFLNPEGKEEFSAMKHWAMDVFWEMPFQRGGSSAFTLYGAYFNHDFGPGYIRNIGANNIHLPVHNGVSFNGAGNSFPVLGTGQSLLFQTGYLLPVKKWGGVPTQLQFFGSMQHSDFDRLAEPMNLTEAGINCYLPGYKTKITLGYQNRPVFSPNKNQELRSQERKAMWVVQYQYAL